MGFIPWVDSTNPHVRGFEATTNLDPGQVLQQLCNPRSPHGQRWEYKRAFGVLTDIF